MFLALCDLLPKGFSPIETVKVLDNIEVTIQQEVNEYGNLEEPMIQVFAMFQTDDLEYEEYTEVWLYYEELLGWQPL